jgi:hypothetical protein
MAIDELKQQFTHEYNMTNLGEARWILEMEIICDWEKQTIKLSQQHYITSILNHFDMANGCPILTPIDVKLIKLAEAESDIKEYQSALGVLMYSGSNKCPNVCMFSLKSILHNTS